ncbi:DUF47 domain-containing protein [Microaerobacter geothermalis]|uniref:DUF47 domain-containing protein n=1 Tax=Microaerobacter geothermalis TaxID=674972 RepID=UPI001F3C2F89
MSHHITKTATMFREGLNNLDEPEQYADKIKEMETIGDEYIHTIIQGLNKTFATPLERDDILTLATTMDDIIDGLEACSSRIFLYNIKKADQYMKLFAENIEKSTYELSKAIELLTKKKLLPMRENTVRINEYENEGDEILRDSLKTLFTNVSDPIEIIKKKEIYEILEDVSDKCEDVADVLESIIMSNS